MAQRQNVQRWTKKDTLLNITKQLLSVTTVNKANRMGFSGWEALNGKMYLREFLNIKTINNILIEMFNI